MIKTLGLCNLHASKGLGPLTNSRALASTSFLGRYAFMDFALSNFSNSGIDKVGILIKNFPRSIIKHLGSSNVFNTNTKLGFEQIMYDEKHANNPLYNHDLNNIRANDWLILETKPDVFVIAPPDIVYCMDFSTLVKDHVERQETITIVYARIKDGRTHFIDEEVVTVVDGRVKAMTPNLGSKDDIDVGLDTFIISKTMLDQILTLANALSATYALKDVIRHLLNEGRTFAAAKYQGYVRAFHGLQSYYQFSMELLSYEFRKKLFRDDWPVYTVSHNTSPARYGAKAIVKNSIIANGAKVYGTVTNSIISRNVLIEEGAVVDGAIIFTDTQIMSGVKINRAIVDKYVRIEKTKLLSGKDEPLYINQGDRL